MLTRELRAHDGSLIRAIGIPPGQTAPAARASPRCGRCGRSPGRSIAADPAARAPAL